MDRKFWRGVFVGLWAAVLLLFLQALTFGAHLSTCRVVVSLGNGVSVSGSGAKIAEDKQYDYVITAAHVVTEHGQLFPNAILQYPGDSVAARVIGYDRGADVALLRSPKTKIPYFGLAEARPGEQLYAEGLVSNTRYSRLIDRAGRMGGPQGVQVSTFTGLARQGDSGGPIRNSKGQVVGVIWGTDGATTKATETAAFVRRMPTPIRNILRIATGHPPITAYAQVPYCPPGQSCEPIIQRPPVEPPYPVPVDPPYTDPPGNGALAGPAGPAGPQGPAGPEGPAAVVDYERIVAAVVAELEPNLQPPDIEDLTDRVAAKLPPMFFVVETQKGSTGPIPKRLGETLTIAHYQIDIDEIAGKVADKLKQ